MSTSRKSVYVETSILSYLCAAPSTVEDTREKQRHTHVWWNHWRQHYNLFISDEIIFEIAVGKPVFVGKRLAVANDLRQVNATLEDRELAKILLDQRLIPPNALVDATHLAISVRLKMDILLTWNLRHLANPHTLPFVYNFLKDTGRHIPVITTPSNLMESV